MSINLTDELNAKTKKGKLGAARQMYLDGDTKNLQQAYEETSTHFDTLDTRSSQMEKAIQDISATGGASTANAVSYDNTISELKAVNIQGAVDEVSSISHFAKRGSAINISTNYNSLNTTEVLTLSQAINKVSSKDRVLGFQGTYLASDGWHTIIYTGDSLSTWVDSTKWINFTDNIFNSISKNATFAGIAIPTTNPGSPGGPVFYLATQPGTYSNFNGIEILNDETVILSWNNGTWSKEDCGLATMESVMNISSNDRFISNVKNGYIHIDDGIKINVSSINNTVYSPIYYRVQSHKTYKINGLNGLLVTLYLYDINKSYIGYYKDSFFGSYNLFTPQENVAYIRIALRHSSSTLTKDTFDYNIWFEEYKIETTDIFNSFQCGKLSIIGDSISTYNEEGYKIEGYKTYYPNYDVNDVKKTYWGRLLENNHGEIEVNASWSGSCITNVRADSGYPSLCDRIPLIGNPDTIIIALGTNDSNDKASIGDYNYDASIAELDESKFAQAYIKGIKMIQSTYPHARIICAIFKMGDSYRTAIKIIADYYGLEIIDASSYQSVGDNKHPSFNGMIEISNKFVNILNRNETKDIATKYGSLLTDISISYMDYADTFTFNESEDTLIIKDSIYLYPIDKSRIMIDASVYTSPIEIGLKGLVSGTKFLVYDSSDKTIKTITPYQNYVEKNDGIYIFAIVQKVKYRVGKTQFGKYEIHTKNNVHRTISKGFDGVFSTSEDSSYFGMNYIKTPGVYIRRDSGSSRGSLLFVSVTNNIISQSYLEIGTDGKFSITERVFNNETEAWSAFKNTQGISWLHLPTISLNGTIIFENNKITFEGSAYIYTKTSRYPLPSSGNLTLTTAITKLIWDRVNNVILDAAIDTYYDESDKVTLGFIVRDSDGNIKNALLNAACQNIVYPIQNKSFASIYNPSKIKYIPHRGVRNAEIPENTAYSVMFAALYGLKYSECDVRYTSDGIGVIMHDATINRTMYNTDTSEISDSTTIADNTFETLSQFVYKSTNPLYRTKIQTVKEYIDACTQWNVCPIIQGSMSADDLEYCMKKLGDNWIAYDANNTAIRQYSDNVLCLTSTNFDNPEQMVSYLKNIGGRVGLSRLHNEQLTDEYIAACKVNGFEIMASYAYEHQNIPDAIRRGVTIVLSDNVGKDTNRILVSSFEGWSNFTHTGAVVDNKLSLGAEQYLQYNLTKKGNYKIYAQFSGLGNITLPNYTDTGVYGENIFPMQDGVFIYTFLKLENESYTINIKALQTLMISRLIIFYEEN